MDFEYIESVNNCWYKNVCAYYDKNENNCTLPFCQRHYKMEYLTHQALLFGNDKYPIELKLDKDGTDRDAFIKLKEIKKEVSIFVEKGRNLVIGSKTCGNGKSSWAKKILLQYLDTIWHSSDYECRALFIDMSKYLNELKNTFGGISSDYVTHIRNNITKANLVIWDEIGLKTISDTEKEYLLNYLNTRLADGKANIFTTNMIGEDLRINIGDRLYSRIIHNSKLIELKGLDKRISNANW